MADSFMDLFSDKNAAEKHQSDPYKDTWFDENKPVGKDMMGNDVHRDGSKSYTNPYTGETKTWQPKSYWQD